MYKHDDEYWMRIALEEAEVALQEDEIPVGALIVHNDVIVARGHNRMRSLQSPLAHAEKIAIEDAVPKFDTWLYGCKLYVTLEPCLMCAGAIILARISAVAFGAYDEKNGACGTMYNVLADRRFNHNPEVRGGVLAEECGKLLTNFFREKRKKQ
jgi:tRNA(adenine34) deaminase